MSCKIPKKKHPKRGPDNRCIIRVEPEQYQAILDICEETGRSIKDVSIRLIDYAVANVEITEDTND